MWEGLQDGDRELLLRMPSGAPATLDETMAEESWWYLFLQFARSSGQPYLDFANFLTQDRDAAIDAIRIEYGAVNVQDDGADDGADPALAYATAQFERLCRMAEDGLRELYPVFPDEVQRIKAWAGTVASNDERWAAQDQVGVERSDPRAVMAFTPIDELDTNYIQQVNEYSWEAAKSAGSVDFIFEPQSGTLLLGPDNFTPQYAQSVSLAGGSRGTVSVDSRGSTFSRGGVTVSGAYGDETTFKRAFRKVSDKSITFG
jgi:hypothetical protein